MNRANCFRAWRKGMGYTQVEASYHLDCDVRTIQRYDSGAQLPNGATRHVMWALAHEIPIEPWPMNPKMLLEIEAFFSAPPPATNRRGLGSMYLTKQNK